MWYCGLYVEFLRGCLAVLKCGCFCVLDCGFTLCYFWVRYVACGLLVDLFCCFG